MKYIFIILIGLILMSGCIDSSTMQPIDNLDGNLYALLAGRSGGQVLNGGSLRYDNLTLNGSSNNNGNVFINPVSGNVGIGLNNPLQKLHLIGYFLIGTTTANASTKQAKIQQMHYYNAIEEPTTVIYAQNSASANQINIGGGRSDENSVNLIHFYTTPLLNTLTGTSRLTISPEGNVTVNGAAATTRSLFQVGNYFYVSYKDGNVTVGNYLINSSKFNVGGGSVRFSSYGAGTATFDSGGNITSVSDAKYKENILPYTRGLKEILQLNPVTYHWNEKSGLATGDLNIGLIANEVKNVIPEIVSTKKDVYYEQVLTKPEIKNKDTDEIIQEAEYSTIEKPVLDNYGKQSETLSYSQQGVIDALINAIKEQQKQIDQLKTVCGGIKP